MLRRARACLGWLLCLGGAIMFPLPGPGLLLLAAGLTILARDHPWAQRLVDRVTRRALDSARAGVRTHWHALGTVSVTVALGASGALWLWDPAQPSWWDLPRWTWLPGGVWSGVGQIVSGAVALALVVHAYVRLSPVRPASWGRRAA